MDYWKDVVLNNLQKQFTYTNISRLVQLRAEYWNKVLGNFKDNFVKDVLNLDTCNDSALNNYWGRILKVTREFDGLDKQGQKVRYRLTTDEYRTVLKIKAYSRKSDSGAYSLNRLLANVFKDKADRVYVTDNLDMTMNLYMVGYDASPAEKWIYKHEDILPRPCGVGPIKTTIVVADFFAIGNYTIEDPRDGASGFGNYAETAFTKGRFATYTDD